MRDFMVKLAGFLGRRRRWVLAGWVVVVALALPIAQHQTDHLTGGGFDVPGSESKAVSDSLESDFGDESGNMAVLLRAEPGADRAQRSAAIDRVDHAVAGLDEVSLPAATVRRAELALQRSDTAMLPLFSEKSPIARSTRRPNCAKTSNPEPPSTGSPPTSPVSRRSGPACRSSPRKT
jgi:uncharacterized membrane protein YdfJ with MMPL/SSD domain